MFIVQINVGSWLYAGTFSTFADAAAFMARSNYAQVRILDAEEKIIASRTHF